MGTKVGFFSRDDDGGLIDFEGRREGFLVEGKRVGVGVGPWGVFVGRLVGLVGLKTGECVGQEPLEGEIEGENVDDGRTVGK